MITARAVPYTHGDTPLTGFLAWDDTATDHRPGLLLVHGGGGLDEHAKGQARRYAALGYIVLACDMFGDGVAGDRERVMASVTGLRDDPDKLLARATAGLATLSSTSGVDKHLAAVGFCFGGMTVLALARAGVDLRGVVSMHGSLKTARPAQPGAVSAKVLVCHGASDPHVPLTDVVALADELTTAGADWQVIMYGGAMHGFTHAHAVAGAIPGVAYDAPADERSFAAARSFLDEVMANTSTSAD